MAEYQVESKKRRTGHVVTNTPPPDVQVVDSDTLPLVDPCILKNKRVTLVTEIDLDSVWPGVTPFFVYSEVDTINAEPNRGARIGKLLDYLQRRVSGKSYEAFNVFLKMIAGTQPQVFTTLAGRVPTDAESNFCIEGYVDAVKESIRVSGHHTDSPLDEKVDLDCEHVQLAIVDRPDFMSADDLPHTYQGHLFEVEDRKANMSALDVLGSDRDRQNPQRVSLYGRAGVGKTTTFQWLARQWGTKRWASQFTLFFLLQLRMLLGSDCQMTVIELLSLHGLYQVTEAGLINPLSSWLKHSASKLLIFIDGLDEVAGFKTRLENCPQISDLNQKAHPIDLCLNILRGHLLPGCTVVTTSRSFTALSTIKFDKQFEILGLTESRVQEFIKCKHPSKVEHIMSTLKKSPLLMSVCGITFYCALISRLLADGVMFRSEDLQTYTRLMAFLIVQCVERKMSEWSFVIQVSAYFHKLAHMAYMGVYERYLEGEMSKLVFNDYDISQAQFTPQDLNSIQEVGLLQIKKIKVGLRHSVIGEFLHFSVQEMLASAYLLSRVPSSDTIKQVFSGGQFNMALLYLFGLQNDNKSESIKDIRFSVDPSRQGISHSITVQLDDVLDCLCQKSKDEKLFASKLQICQLLYEGQMEDKANSIIEYIVSNGKLSIEHTSMTIIDLMAIRFVCKYVEAITEISIRDSILPAILIEFITSSLLKDHADTLQTLELAHTQIGNVGAKVIGKWLQENHTVQTLYVGSNNIRVSGAKALAEALHHNNTLQTLSICNNNIGDNGGKSLAKALHHNSALQKLKVWESNIGENGAKAIAKSLHHNNTLRILNLYGNNIGLNGAQSFSGALHLNSTLQELNVGSNNIGDDGARSIAEALHHNSTLQELNVGSNNIGDDGARSIAEALHHNKTLRTLYVGSNNIEDDGAKSIAEVLHHNSTLQTLFLRNNKVGANGAISLATALHHNKSLRTLNLTENSIGKEGVKALEEVQDYNHELFTLSYSR